MISKEQLSGTWELESWTIGYSDRDDFSYPYGEDPQGLLLYTEDGWMSASICRAGRALLPADVSFRKLPEARQGGGVFLLLPLRRSLPGGGRRRYPLRRPEPQPEHAGYGAAAPRGTRWPDAGAQRQGRGGRQSPVSIPWCGTARSSRKRMWLSISTSNNARPRPDLAHPPLAEIARLLFNSQQQAAYHVEAASGDHGLEQRPLHRPAQAAGAQRWRSPQASHTVPTGFSAVPPSGPAMPDTAMA